MIVEAELKNMNQKREHKDTSSLSRKKSLLIIFIILAVAGGVTAIIFLTEPKAVREGATRVTAMLVNVTEVRRDTYRPTINATGTVQAEQDIMLSPRVSGEVISRSENFTPGGYVKKGEILLQIDPADYQNILALRKSELEEAIADLNIEKGRQRVARQDYALVDDSLGDDNRSLVLREPQLNAIKARVESARASVAQAELELKRTTIRAPFNAHILSRNVNTGSQVAPGQNLGRLAGMDVYWIVVSLPLSKLPWISFPREPGTTGSEVLIRNRTAWEEKQTRTGYIYKLIGALEDDTRLARVLVTVPDPLSRSPSSEGLPPLIIDAFVEVIIQADEIKDVVRLSRDYTRKDNTVWVMAGDTLQIKDVSIKFRDAHYAYISEGLEEGDQVVTTNLTTVAEGASLRTEEDDGTGENNEKEDQDQ